MKQSVCLDCYRQSLFLAKMSLADILREAGSINGVTGFHASTEMLLIDYPIVTDEFLAQWKDLLAEQKLRPVTLGSYIDRLQYRDHVMTVQETAGALRRDLEIAHRLGFQNLRIMHDIPLAAVEAVLPLAEDLNVCLLDELMPPGTITAQPGRKGMDCQHDLELIGRTGTKHFGFLINLGLFQRQPNPTQLLDVLLETRSPKCAEDSRQQIMEQFHSRDFGEFEVWMNQVYPELTGNRELFQRMFGVRLFGPSVSIEDLALIAPHIRDIYAKFICLCVSPALPGGWEEPSIPYAEVVQMLGSVGYDGFLASLRMSVPTRSLGLGRSDDAIVEEECKQVQLHQRMLSSLLSNI